MFWSAAALLSLTFYDSTASAQSIAIPDAQQFLAPAAQATVNPFEQPNREYNGLPVGGWMLYPSLFSGAAFDSNVYQTNANRASDVAWRIAPSIVAVRNTGIQNTMVYGSLDAYLHAHYTNIDNFSGRVGLLHIWEAQRDLIFRFTGDVSRQLDMTTAGGVLTNSIIRPIYYEQYATGGSVMKSFDRIFVAFGGNFANSNYDNTSTTGGVPLSQAYRDFNATSASGRVGYFVTPIVYSYAEATGNWQNYYNSSAFNSEGYRLVGGVGTDRISLFKGELFAGYQQQFYRTAAYGSPTAPVYGGKLYYYPTEYLTFTGAVDEAFSVATFVSPSNPTGSATKATSVSLRADYALAQQWSAGARFGYSDILYIATPRVDNSLAGGATLNYRIWSNFNATLDYQYMQVASNYSAASYARSIVSLGVTYKY